MFIYHCLFSKTLFNCEINTQGSDINAVYSFVTDKTFVFINDIHMLQDAIYCVRCYLIYSSFLCVLHCRFVLHFSVSVVSLFSSYN